MKKLTSIIIAAFTLTACVSKDPMENLINVKTACIKLQEKIALPYLSMSFYKEDDEKRDKIENSYCSLRYTDKYDVNESGRFLSIEIIGDNETSKYHHPEWNKYHVTYVTNNDTQKEYEPFTSAVFTAVKPIAKSKLTLLKLLNYLSTEEFFNKLDSDEIKDLSDYVKEEYKVTVRKFKSETIEGKEFSYIMRIESLK